MYSAEYGTCNWHVELDWLIENGNVRPLEILVYQHLNGKMQEIIWHVNLIL